MSGVLVSSHVLPSEYGEVHPYLCNSRFRHALHQCEREAHGLAQYLFHFLQEVCTAGADTQAEYVTDCHHLGQVMAGYIFGSDTSLGRQRELMLARIISQFISEYRAIFEIEASLETSAEHDLHNLDRKRHDNEEDECPEDVKAM